MRSDGEEVDGGGGFPAGTGSSRSWPARSGAVDLRGRGGGGEAGKAKAGRGKRAEGEGGVGGGGGSPAGAVAAAQPGGSSCCLG
jgi:hypothetical protein